MDRLVQRFSSSRQASEDVEVPRGTNDAEKNRCVRLGKKKQEKGG